MNSKLAVITAIFALVTLQAEAQYSHSKSNSRIYASNASNYYKHQSHLLDSVITRHMEIDANQYAKNSTGNDDFDYSDENPADDIYKGLWGTTGVNAFRADIADVPDSVTISCKGYVPPIIGSINSHFGPRGRRNHYGIDLGLRTGDPVVSAFNGKVRITRYDRGGYGYYVVVRHPNGLETVYGHLSEIKVFEGQSVVAGQTIGLGGSTGRSTGPHLHFETRFLGNPINPEKIFDFETNTPLSENYFLVKSSAFDYKSRSYSSSNNRSYSSSTRSHSRYHKVRRGETLSGIASRYGTTVQKLCKLNRISRRSTLRPGQRLRCS